MLNDMPFGYGCVSVYIHEKVIYNAGELVDCDMTSIMCLNRLVLLPELETQMLFTDICNHSLLLFRKGCLHLFQS